MSSDSIFATSLLQAEWDQYIALKVPFSEQMSQVASTEAMRIGDITLMRIKDGKLVEHWGYGRSAAAT